MSVKIIPPPRVFNTPKTQMLQPAQISKILQQSVPGIIKMRGMNESLHSMAGLGLVIIERGHKTGFAHSVADTDYCEWLNNKKSLGT